MLWSVCVKTKQTKENGVGKYVGRVLKKFTKAEHSLSQQRQLVHCDRWVPRTLT